MIKGPKGNGQIQIERYEASELTRLDAKSEEKSVKDNTPASGLNI